MSEDDKKENSKPVYRFDSEDTLVLSDDEIRRKNPKKYKKNIRDKKED